MYFSDDNRLQFSISQSLAFNPIQENQLSWIVITLINQQALKISSIYDSRLTIKNLINLIVVKPCAN